MKIKFCFLKIIKFEIFAQVIVVYIYHIYLHIYICTYVTSP